MTAPGGVDRGMAIFRIRERGPAREASLVSVLAPADDRRTAARLVREVARVADADYLLAIATGPLGPGGMLRLPRTRPKLTWRSITATAPPGHWDGSLGDIELF